jgi:hypothetical protein
LNEYLHKCIVLGHNEIDKVATSLAEGFTIGIDENFRSLGVAKALYEFHK